MAHGCRIHRHWIPSAGADHEVTPCSYLPLSTTPADRNFFGNSYSSLEAKFESWKEEVLNRYKDDVEHIEVMYQCHFEREMNTPGTKIHEFLHSPDNILTPKTKKPPTMAVRNGLRGGMC